MHSVRLILSICLVKVVFANLHVWKPNYLKEQLTKFRIEGQNAGIQTSISSFGHVPYGHSIIGRVVLANPIDACDEKMAFISHNNHKDGALILQTKRGNCPFAVKTYNAQKAGASLVIFVDDKIEDISHILPTENSQFSHKITIPSVLVQEDVGEVLFNTLQNIEKLNNSKGNDKKSKRDKVLVSVDFTQLKSKTADLQYLLKVDHYQSYKTFKDLNETFTKIQKMVNLKPIYKVSSLLPGTGSEGQYFYWDCLYKEQFCLERTNFFNFPQKPTDTTDKQFDKKLKEHEKEYQKGNFADENLRQICLFDIDYSKWFYYMSNFADNCFRYDIKQKDYVLVNNLDECSNSIQQNKELKKVVKKLKQCYEKIKKSGNPSSEPIIGRNNAFLEFFATKNVPSVIINGKQIREDQDEKSIQDALCESLQTKPEICFEVEAENSIEAVMSHKAKDIHFEWILKVLGFTALACMFFQSLWWIRTKRTLNKEQKAQLKNSVDEFMNNHQKEIEGKENAYTGVKSLQLTPVEQQDRIKQESGNQEKEMKEIENQEQKISEDDIPV